VVKFFLVFQGTTYQEEKKLSCLWAPKFGKSGQEVHHHKRLVEVKINDRIIHLVNRKIVAISTAESKAYDAEAPWKQDDARPWLKNGRKIDVQMIELSEPILIDNIFEKIKNYLPEKYSPFDRNGSGNQGYFYEINNKIFNIILNTDFTNDFYDQDNLNLPKSESTKDIFRLNVRSSTWQSYFKNQLFKLWGPTCLVTGLKNKNLLIGAHIKPWVNSSDEEKIDPYNGLLLSPNADKLFEIGLISFMDDGLMMISEKINLSELKKLGIENNIKIKIKEKNLIYLKYHRENKFK
jgi:putative restriction endonuclease